MSEKKQVYIIHETLMQSILRDVVSAVCLGALIGVGVLLDSDAMQWCGFVIGLLVLIAKGSSKEIAMRCAPQDAANHLATKYGVKPQ